MVQKSYSQREKAVFLSRKATVSVKNVLPIGSLGAIRSTRSSQFLALIIVPDYGIPIYIKRALFLEWKIQIQHHSTAQNGEQTILGFTKLPQIIEEHTLIILRQKLRFLERGDTLHIAERQFQAILGSKTAYLTILAVCMRYNRVYLEKFDTLLFMEDLYLSGHVFTSI